MPMGSLFSDTFAFPSEGACGSFLSYCSILPHATMIFHSNELWCIGQIDALLLLTQSKETINHISWTIGTATQTLVTPAIEGVQPVVNGNLFPLPDVFPGIHIDAFAHCIWITRMVQITAWRKQNRTGFPIEFA